MSSTATIIGNITREPELKYTPSGQAVAKFGVAVNRRKKDAGGNWVDDTPSFFDVVCWQGLAENVAESLAKGTRVVVTGRLEQRSWEQDGQKRYAVEIVADEVAPSLRWATATVVKVQRDGNTHTTTTASTAKPEYSDEPF